jgi:tetratricopeptide (TPR) repeat protein
MKLSFRLLTCAAIFAGLLLADGCNRRAPVAAQPPSPEEKAAAEQRLLSDLNLVFVKANDMLADGRTNEAIGHIEIAFNKHVFAAYRPQILDSLLQMLLHIGRTDDARQRALAASADPALSAGACGLLYRHYRETGDMPNALAWAAELAVRPGLPPDMRRQAFTWAIDDLVSLHNDDQALAMLGQSFQALKPSDGMTLVRSTIEDFFGAGRPESVEKVLALAAGLKTGESEIKHLTVATHVRISSARGDWNTLTNDFPAAVNILNDGELDGLLRAVIPAATKAGKRSVIDQCAEAILFNPAATDKCTVVATAARAWGENAMETDKGAFPGRLEAMLRAKVPAVQVINLFFQYFYSFTEQPVPLKELILLGERLTPLAGDEETRNEIKIKVLDGCFLVQDYDRALTLVESRIPGPGRSEQWHATAIVKIKAHRALQRNEPREAVKYFREFMDLLRTSKDADVSDPVSGLLFPKEMVLGRNAKRIGDILAGIPDPAESAKAYAEAHELYAQALKNTKDAEAIAVIETELAQLPKGGGQ